MELSVEELRAQEEYVSKSPQFDTEIFCQQLRLKKNLTLKIFRLHNIDLVKLLYFPGHREYLQIHNNLIVMRYTDKLYYICNNKLMTLTGIYFIFGFFKTFFSDLIQIQADLIWKSLKTKLKN